MFGDGRGGACYLYSRILRSAFHTSVVLLRRFKYETGCSYEVTTNDTSEYKEVPAHKELRRMDR